MNLLKNTLDKIGPLNEEAKNEARLRWDSLVKPPGSLGYLEDLGIQLAGIRGKLVDSLAKKAIVVMAADNGVVEEGVSASPQAFTSLLAEAMLRGITGVATLAKFVGSDVVTVDVGLNSDFSHKDLINRKISLGSKNFAKEKAMTYEEALESIEVGIEVGDRLFNDGYKILGTGELGMGNTTTSSAVLAAFSGLDVELICGVGAGATKEQLDLKISTIKKALLLHKPNKKDPIDVLSKLGGYDIGAMCGLFLSAAKNRIPIVMDGFISQAAALCAVRLNPLVKEYIVPSHLSDEPGAVYMFKELEMEPILNLRMRLGEGSGCPLAFQLIDAALYTMKNMGTFEDATIDSSVVLDMRKANGEIE